MPDHPPVAPLPPSRGRRIDAVLSVILVIGAVARVVGITFGLPNPYCRPDETTIGSVALRFYSGDFHPHFFNYPALFMWIVAACVSVWAKVGSLLGYLPDPAFTERLLSTRVHLIARLVSATAGITTIWVVHQIALRLFDRLTALIAASFLALAFLHVRDSHFGVTDVTATLLAAAAFLAVVRLGDTGQRADLIGAGLTAGFAASTKYNVALIAVPGLVVIFGDERRPVIARLGRVCIFLAVIGIGFVSASPYSILDWRDFIAALRSESVHLAAGHSHLIGRGWIVHLTTTLRYGMGVPLLVVALAGFVLVFIARPRVGMMLGSFPAIYFAVLGSGYTVFARYMLPVVPFLCVVAGYATVALARATTRRLARPDLLPVVSATVVLILLAPSIRSTILFDRLLARTDNRLVGASWVERHFPEGATIAEYGPLGGHIVVVPAGCCRAGQYTIVPFDGQGSRPDVIVVQDHPISGRGDAEGAAPVLAREYELAAEFRATEGDPRNVYDVQDEFYLPLTGFARITRPGPNLEIYVRRDAKSNSQ